MHSIDLVTKLFYEHDEQLKFLEQYYSDRIGYQVEIRLTNKDTSYFSRPNIFISAYNLIRFLEEDEKMLRPMFYTLLLHELGHAIYTGRLPYSTTRNVVEDNRIEYQIAKWNKRVNFKLMNYIFQDKQLAIMDFERILEDKTALSLALLRAVDNKLYREMCSYTLERKQIVDDIIKYDKLYSSLDYELDRLGDSELNELITLSNLIDSLIDRLIEIREEEKQQPQPQPSQDQEDEQDKQQETEQDANQQQPQQQQAQPKDMRQEQQQPSQEKQELEEQLANLKQRAKLDELDPNYNIPQLKSRHTDTTPYERIHISAFDTKRQSGIKGKGFSQSSVGNAKQLNMKRYMRRNIVANEKMFDKQSDVGRGGKNAKAVFYLDISGSMDGYRIEVATDYLKSFYDTMHNHMDIRLFGFGSRTYELNRNALNLHFISNNLKGSTRLDPAKHQADEQIIVITDGAFDNEITQELKNRARFIVIDFPQEYRDEYFSGVKHIDFIDSKNLQKSLERATDGIKKMLKGV